MKLTAAELHNLSELILRCVNSITNTASYKDQVQSLDIEVMIEIHFTVHVQDYNMKARFVKESSALKEELKLP